MSHNVDYSPRATALVELKIEILDVASSHLQSRATIYNHSQHVPLRVDFSLSSFSVSGTSGELQWRFLGCDGATEFSLDVTAPGYRSLDVVIPLRRDFEHLRAMQLGYVEAEKGPHTLQLACSINWRLPVGKFSEPVRAAVLSDQLVSEVMSNVVAFKLT